MLVGAVTNTVREGGIGTKAVGLVGRVCGAAEVFSCVEEIVNAVLLVWELANRTARWQRMCRKWDKLQGTPSVMESMVGSLTPQEGREPKSWAATAPRRASVLAKKIVVFILLD